MTARLLVLMLLWSSGLALACDEPHTGAFYLDPAGGSDANDCATPEHACKTAARLQTQLGNAGPGTSILLKRGTTLTTTTGFKLDKVSGTEAQPITIGAYGDEDAARPVIDGTGMGGGVMLLACKKKDWYVIQDLELRGNKGVMEWASCKHHTFQRNSVTACEEECVRVKRADSGSYSAHITIKSNTITAEGRTESVYIGTDPAQATDSPDLSQDVVIEDNEMSGGKSHEQIELKTGSQRVTIRNNYIHHNVVTQNGVIFSSRKDASHPPGDHRIEGNTITNITGEAGFAVRIRNDATIENNDISNTSQMGIFLESLDGYPTYKRTVSVKTSTK